jgi:hypothetical protein
LAPCPRWGSEVGDRGRPNITWGELGAGTWKRERVLFSFAKSKQTLALRGTGPQSTTMLQKYLKLNWEIAAGFGASHGFDC